MPAEKFAEDEGMRLPESIFLQTVTGDYPPTTDKAMSPAEIDIILKADPKTVRVVPWAAEPTAQVIHDCFYSDGRRVDDGAARRAAARPRDVRPARLGSGGRARAGVLPRRAQHRRRLSVEAAGRPLRPRRDRPAELSASRRSTSSIRCSTTCTQFCEDQDIEIDTLIHEDGAAQMEINLLHGNALDPRRPGVPVQAHRARSGAAPQDVRDVHGQAAWQGAGQRHAHPPEHRRHQDRARTSSATRTARRRRCSSRTSPACRNTCRRRWRCSRRTSIPTAASRASSSRRSTCSGATTTAPRVCACRSSDPEARRVENRLAGADANPYIAIATSLACGYLGMVEGLQPSRADLRQRARPAVLAAALARRFAPRAARLRAAGAHPRRAVHLRVHHRQGSRIRSLPAGDQLVGARAPAAERLTHAYESL